MTAKTIAKAQIDWILKENGGRKNILPVGMRYCPIIVFENEQSSSSLWSAEVYNTEINTRQSIADVSYLSEDAPHHIFEQTGRKFFLYEGQSVVAEGVIL